jgi:hypothetical protein
MKTVFTSQTKVQRQAKIDFLKSYFPNIESLDFVSSAKLFKEAKQALVDAGHYKKQKGSLQSINDSSVMNLIWDAQGRKRYKHAASRKQSERGPGA